MGVVAFARWGWVWEVFQEARFIPEFNIGASSL